MGANKNRGRNSNPLAEEERLSIGIDVSQDYLDMAAYPSGQIWRYKNNRSGIAKIVAKLEVLNPKIVVMEATGGLECNLRQALDEAGLAIAVVNPKRIRDHGRSMGMLAKTDKLDARVMAHFAAKIERESITRGCELLGIGLDDHIANLIKFFGILSR